MYCIIQCKENFVIETSTSCLNGRTYFTLKMDRIETDSHISNSLAVSLIFLSTFCPILPPQNKKFYMINSFPNFSINPSNHSPASAEESPNINEQIGVPLSLKNLATRRSLVATKQILHICSIFTWNSND